MKDHTPSTDSMSSNPTPERRRLARGTEQELSAAAEAFVDDALDDAIRRGIALYHAEQLEHCFFAVELSQEV